MNIISYNVNGIRAAMKKGLTDWMDKEAPEILCIQETKAQPDQVDHAEFENMGYKGYWHSAKKKGYSGVATYTKLQPENVEYGCGIKNYDEEGRFLRLDFKDFSLLNVYIPSGTTGQERQDYKMELLRDFGDYIEEIQKQLPPLIICGDFNIANHPIDIHNPVSNKNSSGFLPDEREWLTNFFQSGFFDVYRSFHPEPHRYTWWTYRANARSNNKGWRIDYFAASNQLSNSIKNADILDQVVHSDHCPVKINLDF